MRSAKLDSTLESNIISAYVPRFPVLDRITHLAENVFCGLRQIYSRLRGSSPGVMPEGLRPPGDVPHRAAEPTEKPQAHLRQAERLYFSPRETMGDLPSLTPREAADAMTYYECSRLAWWQYPAERLQEKQGLEGMVDAFSENARLTGPDGDPLDLLPHVVRESTLLNRGYPGEGTIQSSNLNALIDRRTGFGAVITYRPSQREVIISFAPSGTHEMGFRQYVRSFLHWLGFVPKTLSQGSQLTRLVKEHLERLNSRLPEDQRVRMTLAGFCHGGALAAYAALRNKVPAVVLNAIRLGNGARARIGETRLREADKYLTEVVIQGDWATDNRLAWLYWPLRLIGIKSYGPLGAARRFLVPHVAPEAGPRSNDPSAHYDVLSSLNHLREASPVILSLTHHCPWLSKKELEEIYHATVKHMDLVVQEIIIRRFGSAYKEAVHLPLVDKITTYVVHCANSSQIENPEELLRDLKDDLRRRVKDLEQTSPRSVPAFCKEFLAEKAVAPM